MYSTTFPQGRAKSKSTGLPSKSSFQRFKARQRRSYGTYQLRNILNGRVLDNTFRSGEKVDRPNLESRDMQFLYHEGEQLVFMDMTTYDQMHMDAEATDGKANYLKDGQECRVLLYNEKPLDIEIPASLVLEVADRTRRQKGDTVSNVTKPATLETGVVIQVPIFVNIGDRVKVDTRTNGYLGRE